ncbi:MAG: DUF6798 domain-containing protein, partial [Bacteroidota bacterium]
FGYRVNNGDQEEHLPYVYVLLDPDLYPEDPLVFTQATEFTVRFYYAHIISFLGHVFPVKSVVFCLYLLCLTSICAGIAALSKAWTRSPELSILTPFFLIPFNGFTIGGNTLVDIQLTCTVPAVALGVWCLVFVQQRRPFLAGLMAALAGLFQILVGIQVGIMGLAWMVFELSSERKIRVTGVLQFLMAFVPGLLPILLPMATNLQSDLSPIDSVRYGWILFDVRNPHHYLPQFFPMSDYIKSAGLWIVAAIVGLRTYKSLVFYRLLPVLGVFLLGALVYNIGFVNLKHQLIGMSQWYKASIWPFLVGFILLVSAFPWPTELLKIFSKRRLLWTGLGVAIFALLLTGNSSVYLPERLASRYEWGHRPIAARERMHGWIRNHLPKSAVVLPPPDDDAFLCQAQRSTPVSYKAIVHTSGFMLNWYSRFCAVYGLKEKETGTTDSLLIRAVSKYGHLLDEEVRSPIPIDYRMLVSTEPEYQKSMPENIIHAEPPYYLRRFIPAQNAAE